MSALVYVSTARGDDEAGDGSAARPVLTYGRALDLSREGDAIVVDGMVGTVPEPVSETRAWLNVLMLVGFALACWAVAIGVLWLVVQALTLWWQHPVGGALVCGVTAIVAYAVYCKRHGISL